MYLPIHFNDEIIAQLPVTSTTLLTREIMGAHEIRADFEVPSKIDSPIGCYVEHNGERYTVNTPPISCEKISNRRYRYSLVFEGRVYRLYDKKFRHLNKKTFQEYGSPADYAQLIADNINAIDSGWTVGPCEDLREKIINFDDHSCRTALDTIAEAFELEWFIVGKVIQFVKQVGNETSLVFKYGRGQGLYSLAYQYQNDKNVVTRVFGYGSPRNLPEEYRDGANQLMFAGLFKEANIGVYGIKEGTYSNEDIYPKVNGVVSAVSAYDPDSGVFTITDSSLDFNLNDYFTADTPKISFLTGELQGQEFEILKYNHSTKTITAKVFVDSSNNTLPDASLQAHVTDTFTLFDMSLPPARVTAAENELEAKTIEYLAENSVPRVKYSLEMDPIYARDNGIVLNPGDKVRVVDEQLGIDEMIRVTKAEYPLDFPLLTPTTKINVEIANFIPYTLRERLLAADKDNQTEIKIVDRISAEKARRNAVNLKSLSGRIFNPDGGLSTGPESIVAGMAAFGYDSQNFNLNEVTISPNHSGDENTLMISAGQLVHRIYQIEGLGYIWELSSNIFTALDPAKFYYVYAKCSKTALIGTFEISETPVSVNDIPGYLAFNLGVLFEVNGDGYRNFEFTKGMTYIVGDQITTGRIKDITSQNYFDLNSGKFNLGDTAMGLDFDVTTPATLTIRGAVAAKVIQVGSDGVINARISGVTDEGSESIRFAAGPGDEFIVRDSGAMESTSGKIGKWNINADGIINEDGAAYIIARSLSYDEDDEITGSAEARIGANVFPASLGVIGVGYFENSKPNEPGTNYAAAFTASGASENIAIEIMAGDIKVLGEKGLTITRGFKIQDDITGGIERIYNLTFTNGILTNMVFVA